ncbi:MAG: site-2 protease family protein [Chloroflexi bacterium]|nr:site-2 protease family protein [Chloroflexota bacterium]
MNLEILYSFILSMIVLVISISIHEFSHAITAEYLGDSTPRRQGRITLNPIAHLDRVGTLMIVMSSLAGFGIGWGKPVQVQPRNFRTSPRAGMGIVAIAGPVSNLLLAIAGSAVIQLLQPTEPLITQFLLSWVVINVALMLFNLIPVFPLDGYNVFVALLDTIGQSWSRSLADLWQRQVQFGPMFLILLLVIDWQLPALSPIQWVFGVPMQSILGVLLG